MLGEADGLGDGDTDPLGRIGGNVNDGDGEDDAGAVTDGVGVGVGVAVGVGVSAAPPLLVGNGSTG